jgi:nuclear pore complex protein Nup107
VQAISWFNNRDNAAKAMNIATVIADDDRPWLQTAFLASGRMTELVDLLARFSRSMLRMTEEFDYKPGRKKGKKGQTIRIWDVNVRN